jgi:putative hemolysin
MQEFFIILALVLLNGLLAGAEIAIVSLRAGRVQELAASGSRAAVALAKLRGNSERFLATVQVGITCVGALAAAFGGATLAERLIAPLESVAWLAPYAEEVALGLVVAAISYLSVVVGELVPKSLALRNAEPYALLAARPLLTLASIAAPAVWLLTLSSNVILRPFRDHTNFTEARISLEEVRQMVNEASRTGSLDEAVGEITSRVIDFAELTVKEVMVHRRFVVALPRSASDDEVRHALLEAGHRRIPIYDKGVDHIVGYVSWRDVIDRVWKGEPPSIDTILRPAHFVPENRLAIDLLHEMREQRIHLAIVIDEHGGLAGIVTLEDLLEELVGDIVSEHSTTARTAETPSDGPLILPGTTPIRDVERELELEFGDYPEDYATIGGWCVALAGDRIPMTGERFQAEGIEIEVLEASPRRVRSVAVRVLPEQATASA